MIEKLRVPPEGAQPLHFESQYSRSTLQQLQFLLRKNFIVYWRTPEVIRVYTTNHYFLIASFLAYLQKVFCEHDLHLAFESLDAANHSHQRMRI